jgi:RNA polymerase sigma factor (sigma-70 family)
MADSQNEEIQQTVHKERKRLFDFIRSRVKADEDAEDILQDVFYEFVSTYRLMKPVEQIASWLFAVARNKITDSYRKKKTLPLEDQNIFPNEEEGEMLNLGDLLADDETVESKLARDAIMEALEDALDELPEQQREVFVMHELEGRSFKEIAELTGEGVNTLLSRKRYAVLFLREKLRGLYEDTFS